MKRIVCTVTNDLTHDQRMIRICTALSAAGYAVLLVGRTRPHSTPLPDRTFEQRRLSCYFERGIGFYLEFQVRLFLFLLRKPFDLVYGVDLDSILPVFLAGRLKGKRSLYDAHEYYTESPELVHRPGPRRVWELIGRWIVPRVDFHLTVGEELAAVLAQQYGKPFAVVRNLPEQRNYLVNRKENQEPVILYQGVLNVGRGLEEAIEAVAGLPAGELWLAGEGDLSEALRRQVRQLGAEDRVRFLGWVAPAELRELTGQATIGLNLLARLGLNYYYSLANKALDYIQAGVPCITMDFPEYRKLQDTFGVFHLIDELSADNVAEAIRELLENASYRQSLAENCRKAAPDLVWEQESKQLLSLVEAIFAGSQGPSGE